MWIFYDSSKLCQSLQKNNEKKQNCGRPITKCSQLQRSFVPNPTSLWIPRLYAQFTPSELMGGNRSDAYAAGLLFRPQIQTIEKAYLTKSAERWDGREPGKVFGRLLAHIYQQ